MFEAGLHIWESVGLTLRDGERMHGRFRVKANVVMISDGFCY
jgi:hypothetical protein